MVVGVALLLSFFAERAAAWMDPAYISYIECAGYDVYLEWYAPEGATTFRVYRSYTGGLHLHDGEWTRVDGGGEDGGLEDTCFLDPAALESADYAYYIVYSWDGSNYCDSSESPPAYIAVPTPTPTPTPPPDYFKVGGPPKGGSITSYPSTAFRTASGPVWKCYDQFISGQTVDPLTASFSATAWSDPDERWNTSPTDHKVGDEDGSFEKFVWTVAGGVPGAFTYTRYVPSPGFVVGSLSSGASASGIFNLYIRDADLYKRDAQSDTQVAATGSPNSVSIRVYDSHLTRDIANVAPLRTNATGANCYGAANHAFDGTASEETNVRGVFGSPHPIFDKNNSSSFTLSQVLANLDAHAARGRLVRYSGAIEHVETLTGAADATWGCNTPAEPGSGKWIETSITSYYNHHGPTQFGGDGNLWFIDIYY